MIGHPGGLPLKFADGADVPNNLRTFFQQTSTLMAATSARRGFSVVEGILVSGAADFTEEDGTRSLEARGAGGILGLP